MRNFREYNIWIDSMELVNKIYNIVKGFPDEEKFGLKSQIKRSAISIPSNIAEGASRNSEKDFVRYLEFSLGSAFELETQIRISQRRKFLSEENSLEILNERLSLQKRISGLRNKISQ